MSLTTILGCHVLSLAVIMLDFSESILDVFSKPGTNYLDRMVLRKCLWMWGMNKTLDDWEKVHVVTLSVLNPPINC